MFVTGAAIFKWKLKKPNKNGRSAVLSLRRISSDLTTKTRLELKTARERIDLSSAVLMRVAALTDKDVTARNSSVVYLSLNDCQSRLSAQCWHWQLTRTLTLQQRAEICISSTVSDWPLWMPSNCWSKLSLRWVERFCVHAETTRPWHTALVIGWRPRPRVPR